ncbi:MAG: hypothetical protein D4S01_05990 [Dehalococcoidia bacterium]|nr:MAG: hypothetical protein D4S01_05990 [Dehalococcoidia bacterium]
MKYFAHDTETTLIGRNNVIPDLICSSLYELGTKDPDVIHWSPREAHWTLMKRIYGTKDNHIILHNASFDLGVLAKSDWSIMPIIWEALGEGRVHDTMIREKLLNLTLTGSIDIVEAYGIKTNTTYSLADLVLKYLQIDLKDEKEAEDGVRMNYAAVKDIPLDKWPKAFVEYAGKDAEYTGLVFLAQEERREKCIQDTGYDPFAKESFTVSAGLALQFMTAQGSKMDTERVKEVTKEFLDHYNSDELVWPLVHSKYVQEFMEANPTIRRGQVIDSARKSWDSLDKAEQKKYDGTGMTIPAISGVPFKNGAQLHGEQCIGHKDHPEYKKGKKVLCACPVKTKAPQPEKGNTGNLHQYAWDLARRDPTVQIWLSKKSKEILEEEGIELSHPVPRELIDAHCLVPSVNINVNGKTKPVQMKLQVNKEWLATYAALDPVMSVYDERHKIQKIVTSYLPCMYWADQFETGCPVILEGQMDKFSGKQPADRVHAQFSALKETGRTSSFASKRGNGNSAKVTFPSWNGQQVDPRIRPCVIPEDGNVLFSIDFSAMELCTAAQVSHDLLGYEGVLMGLINGNKDTHSYLGAQIAVALDGEFTTTNGLDSSDPMGSYDKFKGWAGSDVMYDGKVFKEIFEDCYVGKKWGDHVVSMEDCTMGAYYKHFRTFGKPTGLGFWGGLGEATFISMAKSTYGIAVDMPTAELLRGIWREYIPEGQDYLNYVNKHMIDRLAEPEMVEGKDGKKKKRRFYCYDTPLGMHRAKCSFTAAANGCALQSPSAEGALGGVVDVMKEVTIGSLAGYVFPSIFIHDELFGEIVYDEHTTQRIQTMQKIMVDNFEKVTPNVRASTEACIMNRWDKRAEPVWENDKLVPWESK